MAEVLADSSNVRERQIERFAEGEPVCKGKGLPLHREVPGGVHGLAVVLISPCAHRVVVLKGKAGRVQDLVAPDALVAPVAPVTPVKPVPPPAKDASSLLHRSSIAWSQGPNGADRGP